jgi:cyclin H
MLEEDLASNQQSRDSAATSAPAPDEIQYLTVADELSLVVYYLAQLVRLCKTYKFPLPVESTAMTYVKRFYLRNTCMDYHPKNVM